MPYKYKPLTDTQVKVSFVVSKDGEEAVSKDYDVTVPGTTLATAGTNPAPKVLPALLNWVGRFKSGTVFPEELPGAAVETARKSL